MVAAVNSQGRRKGPLTAALFPVRAAWAAANRFGLMGKPLVGSSPHLNPQALARWRDAIGRSNIYLEYGSGGSTVEAVRSAAQVMSVDTDRRYLAAVEAKVAALEAPATFHPIFVDIGWTGKWGRPLIGRKSQPRLERWRQYPSAPWVRLEELGLVPDFIFVDGRFRTASVLESFLRLPAGADCLFMLDDFDGRTSRYGEALGFATEIQTFDRTVTFRRDSAFDRERCRELLQLYYRDPE